MKITVYTTTDCQYSKQERDYLVANKLQYEEKNLETNKEFLTEMLAISNNFAGTPVTRVEKDDGSIAVLKGFTKEEFDTTFGFTGTQTAPAVPPAAPPIETPTVKTPVAEPVPTAEVTPAPPVVAEVSASVPPPSGATVNEAKSDELNSILGKLEEQATQAAAPPAEVPPVQPTPTNPTNSEPTIPPLPDFSDATKTTA